MGDLLSDGLFIGQNALQYLEKNVLIVKEHQDSELSEKNKISTHTTVELYECVLKKCIRRYMHTHMAISVQNYSQEA